jgi:hypothetical protein
LRGGGAGERDQRGRDRVRQDSHRLSARA